jgi:hypothetical protein
MRNAAQTTAEWTPQVLSEYEVGRVMAAIETIARLSKPIAEVGCRKISMAALESDLRECLALASADGVRFWTKTFGDRVRYGFYRESWALDALDFLERRDLSQTDRAWISGLLFGYRPDAIQQFISSRSPRSGDDPWTLPSEGL